MSLESDVPHVVILGGGFGGLFAARALDRAPVRVTLIDRHNYHLFQPLLYQVATASLSPADVASPIRWVLRRQKNVQVLLAEARAIDPVQRQVVLDPGPARTGEGLAPGGHDREPRVASRLENIIAFDYLILATGAAHSYFGHDDWAKWAPGLKTLDDALQMRQQILLAFEAAERATSVDEQRRLLTFVIIGGGPTGVELAGALAEIARQSLRTDFRRIRPESAHILLLEGSPHLLGTFPEPLREAARHSLERLGVDVRTSAQVVGVDAEGVTWRAASGEAAPQRIAAHTILWAAGIAASPLARSLGVPLDRAGRVAAEPTLAVTGHPTIFLAGDICAFAENGKLLPGVAQVAMQEGAHAARNIVRAIRKQPLQPFHYRDYGIMATIGRGAAVGDIFGLKISGFFAWLFWIFLHIFWLIGFRNRVAVISEWAWAYLTFQRRVRLITAEHVWQSPADMPQEPPIA
jgi:NADH:ubiquinone reductase (H+-translocating)